MRKMNKKGMELSVNFIVILIISLVIFVGSIALTFKFFKNANDYSANLDDETERQIHNLLSDGSKVAIPVQKKVIKRSKTDTFGLGVYNALGEEATFYVKLQFANAYTPEGKSMADELSVDNSYFAAYINQKWIFDEIDEYTLENNEQLAKAILVKVDGSMSDTQSTRKGTYSFDVCVFHLEEGVACDDITCNCDKSNPNLYDNHIHKIYVEVP